MRIAILAAAGLLAGTLARVDAAQTRAAQDGYLARLAVELGADRDVVPIRLGPDQANPVAVVYDRFSRAHHIARQAFRRNAPLDPLRPPRDLITGQMLIVAGALECGDRRVRPTDIDITRNTQPVSKWLAVSGAALQKLLPGVPAPDGAIGVQFAATDLREGQIVRVSYADTICSGKERQISIPVNRTNPRIIERPEIEMPMDQPAPASSITLTLAGVVDLDGHIRYASAPEAKTPFGKAALAAANKMKFNPARVNGWPVPFTDGVIVTFGAAAAPPPAVSGSTPDVAGLTAASSKCEVSIDDSFGRFVSQAIRIGGKADGMDRIKKFLTVLRGPSGQGLRYEFSGPVMMAGKAIEGVEVRYAGLAEAQRLYFDTSLDDKVLAPKGFTCAAPIVVK